MTDTPGWASPSSPEPPREDAGPSAAVPPTPGPGPYDAAYGQGPYGGTGPQSGWGPQAGGPPPGWGQPGWGPPPSPKPGVIPLRPLGVGEILDGAFTTVRTYWRTMLGLSLGVAAVEQSVLAVAQWWQYEQPDAVGPLIMLAFGYLLGPLLGIVASALLTMVVSKAILGQPVSIGAAWAAARPQLLKMTGLSLLTGLAVLAVLAVSLLPMIIVAVGDDADPRLLALTALFLLPGMAVAAWIGVQLILAAPALMLEKQGVFTALSRSRRLVKGAWWRTFLVTLLIQVLAVVFTMIVMTPFTILGAVFGIGTMESDPDQPFAGLGAVGPPVMILIVSVGAILASTLTVPVQAAVNVLLYVDRRIRREGLDIELTRAAGIPGQYGPQGT
ncbi:glycerophosphoryl diester phosphodiesterase membrane domain-containing protein [Kitasatospora sp. CMC57]|uniref:Glycerophosphoryl diester phosphodiesterase membrane domain-containing protein n=1 Tax=Kitasatospora sp. CMC57 TaxID=3231513 RepID=A0AB33JXA1_9ACTN